MNVMLLFIGGSHGAIISLAAHTMLCIIPEYIGLYGRDNNYTNMMSIKEGNEVR